MGEQIPLRWLQFDKNKLEEIRKCPEHDGAPILTLKQVIISHSVIRQVVISHSVIRSCKKCASLL